MQIKQIPGRLRTLLSVLPKPHKPSKENLFLLIVSLASAMLLWAYIVPDMTPHITDIPVSCDLTGTRAEDYALQLLPESEAALREMTVTADIEGNRAAIGGLNKKNLEAYVDFDKVSNTPGEQTLELRLRNKETHNDIASDFIKVTLNRKDVTVNLDHYTSKNVPVSKVVERPNITTQDAETLINEEGITVDPTTVIVRGPSTKLDQIDHVCLTLSEKAVLSETKTIESLADCTLMSSSDREIDNSLGYYSVQQPHFSVTFPVYYRISLPATGIIPDVEKDDPNSTEDDEFRQFIYDRVRLNGSYTLPGYGDENAENLIITIRTNDRTLKENLDAKQSIECFNSRLSEISINPQKPIEQEIKLPEGMENISEYDKIYFCIDTTGLETRDCWIKNSDIEFQQKMPGFEYQPDMPGGMTPVTLIGPPEELSKFNDEDLKLWVDLNTISTTKTGIKNVSLNVKLPQGVSNVWYMPQPKMDIYITESKTT